MGTPRVAQTPQSVNLNVDLLFDQSSVARLLSAWVRAGTQGFDEEVFEVRRSRVFAILRQCFYLLQEANVDPMDYREALVRLGAIIPIGETEASR